MKDTYFGTAGVEYCVFYTHQCLVMKILGHITRPSIGPRYLLASHVTPKPKHEGNICW